MASGDNKIIGKAVSGTVQTSNDSPTTLCVYRLNNSKSVYLKGVFVGQRIGVGGTIVGGIIFGVANSNGDVCTVQSSSEPVDLMLDPGTAGYSAEFDNDGLDVRLRVTGGASDTVRWFGYIEITECESIFKPIDLNGCILWLDADVGITVDGGGDVTLWEDQSGSGFDVGDAGGNPPEFDATGGPNSMPAVNFVRADSEYLIWPDSTLGDVLTNYTLFTVLVQRSETTDLQQIISFESSAGQDCSWSAASQPTPDPGAYNSIDGWIECNSSCIAGAQILTHVIDDTNNQLSIYRDGILVGATQTWDASIALSNNVGTTIHLGSYWSVPNHHLDAAISEVILYNRVLSAAEIYTVNTYLQNKYSLEFTPLSIGGCILWLDAAVGVSPGLDGVDVDSWADQSGNGNDATQDGIAGNKPEYSDNTGPNGMPAVIFDKGNLEWMDLTGLSDASQNLTFFAVLIDSNADISDTSYLISWHQYGGIMLATGPDDGIGYSDEGTGIPHKIADKLSDQMAPQCLTWKIIPLTSVECFRDGISIGSSVPSTQEDIGTSVALGATHPTWANAYHMNGLLSELIIYNTTLSTDHIATVNNYLMNKYSLEFTPRSINGCVLWLRADLGVTLSDDKVTNWADQSGNGNDASQATPANQPTWKESSFGEQPSIEFDGINDYLAIADDATLNPGTGSFLVVMVANLLIKPFSGWGVMWAKTQHATGDNVSGFHSLTNTEMLFWGNNGQSYTESTAAKVPALNSIWAWGIDDQTNEVIYVTDSKTIERKSVTIQGTGSNAEELRIAQDTAGNYKVNIRVAEMIMYKCTGQTIPDEDIQALIDYLAARYNI